MPLYAHTPIVPYVQKGRRGIILDTNLLLLYLVGSWNRECISTEKRLVGHGLDSMVYDGIVTIISKFPQLVVTTHILTELCNLSDSLNKKNDGQFFRFITDWLQDTKERRNEARHLTKIELFHQLGLADSSLIQASLNGYFVLTIDVECAEAISRAKGNGLNYNNIRLWR